MVKTSESGYVALMAVLITAAVAVATCLTILDVATYRARDVGVEQQSVTARSLASGCAEEALQVVNDASGYTGSGTYILNGNTCSYTVTSTGSTTRTILAVATVGNVVRKIQVYVTIGSTTITVTSWQDIT